MSHTSIEELLGTNKYEVDPDEAHIVVDKAACPRCLPQGSRASRHVRQAYSRSSVEQWRSTMQVALNVGLVALSVGKRQSRGTIPGAVSVSSTGTAKPQTRGWSSRFPGGRRWRKR